EHRLPLNRLVLVTLMRLSGNDFRSGMLGSVAVLGASTAYLLASIRQARGHLRFTDAALPVLLMGPVHHANLLWTWQIEFALSAGLRLVVLGALIRSPSGLRFVDCLVGGLALALLPLTGLNGVGLVPAIGVGLLVGAIFSRDRRVLALALVAIVLALFTTI